MELIVLLFLFVVTAFVFYWVGLRRSRPHRSQDGQSAAGKGTPERRRRPF
jgi:hypothetical protein